MNPRAFVIMPFGKKPLGSLAAGLSNVVGKSSDTEIDFDGIYQKLLEPALAAAGCDPFRADSETAAGDIRTDMFFELITADLVVADISILNPNVYYELGVRHGVRPGGVLVIQGSFGVTRPFDIAPDRTFSYNGSLFIESGDPPPADFAARLNREIQHLSQTFRNALSREQESTDSPVYQHLPGLVAVNWDKIQTSKANYFGALSDDWLHCVRIARGKQRPGDIKTLADNAPTLAHRTKILYEAALALIDLCRYRAAERELREVIRLDPDHFEAHIQLGRVLTHQGKTDEAEQHLQDILHVHENEHRASELLAEGSRYLWHLSWRDEPQELRQKKAVETSQLAAQAVRNFIKAHKSDPAQYYSGFNALIMIAIMQELHKITELDLSEDWPATLTDHAIKELATVVQFCARNAREKAIQEGDAVSQFLATTTLSGTALVQQDETTAFRRVQDACNIPGATFLQLQTFLERLSLIDELDLWPGFIKKAISVVWGALVKRSRLSTSARVFLFKGYPLDQADSAEARFPASSLAQVQKQIEEALEQWNVQQGDLAICQGVEEGDIFFAEACQKRKATVRLMVLQPSGGQPLAALWPFESEEWTLRFSQLRSLPNVEVWFHSEHLGATLNEDTLEGIQALQRRQRSWLINTAALEAEPAVDPWSKPVPSFTARLFGLFLWNGENDENDPGHPASFIRQVNEFNGYEGQVRTIRVLPPKPHSKQQDAATAS